ncbi:MFS transporter [Nocardioides sp. NBC_00368]|uniref:MFS transporter n=1 Tax=Nocardioides sp. NBC_00368 TaxID=2976000 RepID=UPI002E20651B
MASQSILAQAAWVSVKLMIGYRAIAEGADASFLAVLTATFAAPALLAALPSGRFADRWGGAAAAAVGSILAVAGVGLVLLLPGLGTLLAGSAIVGLGNMIAMVGQQTLVAHVSHDDRDGAYGFLSASASAGQMVGPPLVTFLAGFSSTASGPDTGIGLTACLVMSALALPLSVPLARAERSLSSSPGERSEASTGRGGLLSGGIWRAMVISGIVLVSMDMLYTFLPIWALDGGVAAGTVGMLLALRAAVSLLSRVGLSRLVGRFGRARVIVVSTALAAIAMGLLPLVGVPGAVVVMILLGVGLGIPQPLTMAWAVALTEPHRHGLVLGLRLGANRLAQIVVPLAMSATVATQGAGGVFWANSGLLAGCTALAAVRSSPEKPHSEGP